MKKWISIALTIIIGIAILGSCQNEETTTENAESKIPGEHKHAAASNYMNTGQELAMKMKASLGEKLSSAIAENGVAGAVEFCNIEAITITDSVSQSLNAKIKRVSDKPRNPTNQAKEGELFYIDMCKQNLENGKELKPFISEDDKKMIGYYPIVTNSMCLNCHGTKDKIKAETLAKINSLYPEDKATGYKENELRGIFVVEMDK